MLHGKGHDRWYDKSFCMVVTRDAKMGCNIEHSWSDAPIMFHFTEYLEHKDHLLGYDHKGHCNGDVQEGLATPSLLRWEIGQSCADIIATSYQLAKTSIDQLQLQVRVFNDFGKDFMKSANLSPDAFVQMALQLAYYRDQKKFSLTYEATMTRCFLKCLHINHAFD